MYKDKCGWEYEDFEDIRYDDENWLICPCCGDFKDVDDIAHTLHDESSEEIECMKCGCIFEVSVQMSFSVVCKKYRTDGNEGESDEGETNEKNISL